MSSSCWVMLEIEGPLIESVKGGWKMAAWAHVLHAWHNADADFTEAKRDIHWTFPRCTCLPIFPRRHCGRRRLANQPRHADVGFCFISSAYT